MDHCAVIPVRACALENLRTKIQPEKSALLKSNNFIDQPTFWDWVPAFAGMTACWRASVNGFSFIIGS
jgi:hypothetical protein